MPSSIILFHKAFPCAIEKVGMEDARHFYEHFAKPFCQSFNNSACRMDCPVFEENSLEIRFTFWIEGPQEEIFFFMSALNGFAQFWKLAFINKCDYSKEF